MIMIIIQRFIQSFQIFKKFAKKIDICTTFYILLSIYAEILHISKVFRFYKRFVNKFDILYNFLHFYKNLYGNSKYFKSFQDF